MCAVRVLVSTHVDQMQAVVAEGYAVMVEEQVVAAEG